MSTSESEAGFGAREPGAAAPDPVVASRRRLAISTAFFSLATALSRVAGLIREVVAASLFGVSGPMSAFTIAFQVPNLIRALVADSALQGAFVPVFSELLQDGRRAEAFRVASGLLSLITLVLGGLTLVFILVAPVVMPLFTPGYGGALEQVTVLLAQLMFPIVLLLAISGVIVGMLNSFEHFSAPALAPLAWNAIIIAALAGLTPAFGIYSYAIGVLAGTVVQLLLPLPWLRGRGGRFSLTLDWRGAQVGRVLRLMLPVTIALGLINLSLLVNSALGTLVPTAVPDAAPAAIDKAFRIYMLPQGIFSVAVATVLFPTLAQMAARGALGELRAAMANGVRQICLLLIPSAALVAVLTEPITRLVYERAAFDARATDLVAEALFWWAFSLPFQGVSLLYSRTFFSLKRPWLTTAIAVGNLAVNVVVALALYRPLGVGGIVIGTVVGTVAMTVAQALLLRRELGGVEGRRTVLAAARMLLATVPLGVASVATWSALDALLGRSLFAQVASVGAGVVAGFVAYGVAVWLLRVPEARQVADLVPARLRRRR